MPDSALEPDVTEGAQGSARPPRSVPSDAGAPDAAAPAALPHRRWWAGALRVLVLLSADMVGLVSAVGVAFLLWASGRLGQPADLYIGLLAALPVFPVAYAAAGLYPGFGVGASGTIRLLSQRTSIVFATLAAASFIFKLPHEYSRMTFALAWIGCLFAVPALRFGALVVARHWRWWPEPALAVGSAAEIEVLGALLDGSLSLGYRLVGQIVAPGIEAASSRSGLPVVGLLGDTLRLERRGFRVVFLVVGEGVPETVLLASLQEHFRRVIVVRMVAGMPVEGAVVRDLGGVLGIEFLNRLLQRRNRFLKRAMDLLLGGAGLVVASPVIGLAAAAVRLASPGPAIFGQVREGRGGVEFRVWKLRTMYADAEGRLREHLAANPAARDEWERAFKLRDDPRIVPGVGRLLRRFSVDELPQLWNVVVGEMSLVGPRPFPIYHLDSFSPEFRQLRRRVRPGLTGLWQVSVRSAGGLDKQQAYDSHYIWNWSIWLDLHVLVRTARPVVRGDGAF